MKNVFLQFVRLGIGFSDNNTLSDSIDWYAMKTLAEQQGLSSIVLDGLNSVHDSGLTFNDSLPLDLKLEWIGEVLRKESIYETQQNMAIKMALLFHNNAIRTYVLKGAVVAECYPNPIHRYSVDMDCFLTKEFEGSSSSRVQGVEWDAWLLGNDLIKAKGFGVNLDYYKNSTFILPGLTVENHHFITPFRGNEKLKRLEKLLQSWIHRDTEFSRFERTWLYRPPVMVTALFLIEHSYSHFLHEGLTWKLVLDWMMFSKKHKNEIDWREFDALIDEFGFRKFYDSFSRLGQYLIGEVQEFNSLRVLDKRMLDDIWAPLDLHDTARGVKGKLALAGNTWRARWKYRCFTDISWIHALWIQVKGVLFEKEPKLN